MTEPASKSVLFLSYIASQKTGLYRLVTEELIDRLPALGWRTMGASGKQNRLLRMLDVLLTIWRLRREYQVAHVDVFSGLAFIQAELSVGLLRLLGKPVVLTLRGGNLPAFSQGHPRRVRRLLNAADQVAAPSDYLRDALRPFRSDMVMIPNGVALQSYHFHLREKPAPKILWLRAMHAIYNPTLAVEVIARLRRRYPDIHLWMVGPDKGEGTLENVKTAIAAAKLEQHIEIIGGVPKAQVPAWMDKADILINTTNIDNTPVSLIEAMASGLCLVTTNVGGIPALLHDGVDGLLVPPADAEAMANAAVRLIEEPGFGAALSRQAYVYAQRCDWSVVLRQWDDLLLRVARGASGGGGSER
ncbi:MAG: glycosyltransferase family 4 protein [Anaerolineae bacterium]|nr:glycosyltransferase family 4 protein [Anaerolineae bacterium]NUQ06066.1 glycosyltransferase family 4 protein [Anaerolineae bacterium]